MAARVGSLSAGTVTRASERGNASSGYFAARSETLVVAASHQTGYGARRDHVARGGLRWLEALRATEGSRWPSNNRRVTLSKDLIAEIEGDALDDHVPVATALRKCVVLGGRSGSEELRDWATGASPSLPPTYRHTEMRGCPNPT